MTAWLAEARRGCGQAALPYPAGRLCSLVVIRLSQILPVRLCSMLCIGLMFAFASANMANVVDRIQHQSAVVSDHDHLPFSKIVFDNSDHPEHDTAGSGDTEDAPDHQPGTGNHHHADTGSGLLAPLSQGSSWVLSETGTWRPSADNRMPGFLTHGPERPPKSSAIPA